MGVGILGNFKTTSFVPIRLWIMLPLTGSWNTIYTHSFSFHWKVSLYIILYINQHSTSELTFVIEIPYIFLKLFSALVNGVEGRQSNITLHFGPLRNIIDVACGTGYLSWFHGGWSGKVVALLFWVLNGKCVVYPKFEGWLTLTCIALAIQLWYAFPPVATYIS